MTAQKHQIVRIADVSDAADVTIYPKGTGWAFLISHPSKSGKNYYYVRVPAELILNRLHGIGTMTTFRRQV